MLGPLQNFFALYSQAEESLATFDKQYSETFFHLLDPCRKCRLCDTARSRGTREVPFACQCSQKFEMPKDHVDIYLDLNHIVSLHQGPARSPLAAVKFRIPRSVIETRYVRVRS